MIIDGFSKEEAISDEENGLVVDGAIG